MLQNPNNTHSIKYDTKIGKNIDIYISVRNILCFVYVCAQSIT